ncbi:hypothetical protein MNBD_GAMMA11-420, partial [hydrothermal vent metagenome]
SMLVFSAQKTYIIYMGIIMENFKRILVVGLFSLISACGGGGEPHL